MTQPPRILFAGTPDFAALQLRALLRMQAAGAVQMAAVLAQPDRRAGRGMKVRPGAVSELAREAGLRLLQPPKLHGEAVAEIADLHLDLVVVAAYGLLLPDALLQLPRCGCVNVHASLLPRHRGAAPVAHAILAGDSASGISFMLMDAGLDTGPVLRRHRLELSPDWNSGELTQALGELAAAKLPALVGDWLAGEVTPQAQDDEAATWAPRLRKADAHLNFAAQARQVQLQVRAYGPAPGAWCLLQTGQRLRVLRAQVLADAPPAAAAVAIGGLFAPASGKGRLAVRCGEGAVELLQVQPAGGRALTAAAVLNGNRPGFAPGDRLA